MKVTIEFTEDVKLEITKQFDEIFNGIAGCYNEVFQKGDVEDNVVILNDNQLKFADGSIASISSQCYKVIRL